MMGARQGFGGIESSPGRLELDDRLIFMHFEKTAGTTVHHCLARLFASSAMCPERFHAIRQWPPAMLRAYRYFSAHARLGDFRFVPGPVKVVTFLRDPVERCLSLYEYWSTFNDAVIERSSLAGPRLAKSYGIDGMFSEENAAQCGYLWNGYAYGLAGDAAFSPSGEVWRSEQEVIERALANLEAMAFVGITEDLRTSFERLCAKFDVPNFYAGQVENATKVKHLDDPTIHEERAPLLVTAATLERVAAANRLDAMIYRHAVERFFGAPVVRRSVACFPYAQAEFSLRVGRTEAWVENRSGGYILFGPYMRLLPGRYRAEFRIRIRPGAVTALAGEFGQVDVIARGGVMTIGVVGITADFLNGEADALGVDFVLDQAANDIEFRVLAAPGAAIEVCREVTLLRYL